MREVRGPSPERERRLLITARAAPNCRPLSLFFSIVFRLLDWFSTGSSGLLVIVENLSGCASSACVVVWPAYGLPPHNAQQEIFFHHPVRGKVTNDHD